MKIKNLTVGMGVAAIILGILTISKVKSQGDSIMELQQVTMSLHDVHDDVDELKNNFDDLEKVIMQQHEYQESLKEDSSQTEEEKIAEYASEITEEDVNAYVREVLDFYGITAKSNTFRFNPNNLQEAEKRIKEYAEKMDSEENKTFVTEYYIDGTVEDFLVYGYKKEYQESHREASEEELNEVVKEFKEKAAAAYYTKMNLKYLSDETLRAMNEKYHFVDESKNLIEDIKEYADSVIIRYMYNPLMREMVANQGDYIAHGLLDENTNTKRYCALIGSGSKIVNEVIHGDYGNGEERKENLGKEGYNYFAIQDAVNLKLGVVSDKKTVFYRIENGAVVSNLPVLPENQEELYKYLLIELKYQSQHYGLYGQKPYDPSEFLIKQVIFGHYNQLEEWNYHWYEEDAIDFFKTLEKVQKVTENSQKVYK